MANVTVIPATRSLHSKLPINTRARRRVAGYARVSTDSEEQLTSYEAQVDYYTKYIRSNPDWEFVDVYTDEGISAVSTRGREGFNRMIEDAGRSHRPDCDQISEPLRPEHRGQPHRRPEAEGTRDRGVL